MLGTINFICSDSKIFNHMNRKIILYSAVILLLIVIAGYFFPTPVQITRVRTNTNHTVSAEELVKVKSLFQKNNIDIGTLAINNVVVDERGESHVRAEQFYNKLPIFLGGQIIYHFHSNGKVYDRSIIDSTKDIYTSGNRIGDLNIPIEPSISASAAARKARESMKLNYFFTGELGFWDLNAGTSDPETSFILVWKVMPRGAEEYPYAIIDANDGKLIRYWDGVIIN